MTDTTRHPVPGFGPVLLEQIRVVGLAVRREAMVLAGVLFLVGLLVLVESVREGDAVTGDPLPPVLMIALGALTPFAVWKGERVFGGGYLWTLPVEQRGHALSKVLAGGLWLMAAVSGFQLWILALALLTGGSVGQEEVRMLLGSGDVSDPTPVRWTTQWWEWVSPFSAAAVCYLIGSAFVLGARYPLRWGSAAVAAFIGMGALAESGLTGGFAEQLFLFAVDGPVGINAATVGGGDAIETKQPTGGRDFIGPEVLVLWSRLPSVGQWAPAVLFWAALALAALWIAASRHHEA